MHYNFVIMQLPHMTTGGSNIILCRSTFFHKNTQKSHRIIICNKASSKGQLNILIFYSVTFFCCCFVAIETALTDQSTYVNDGCCTAVQMFVQVIQHLPQLLHGLLVWLQEHGLEVHWQPVSGEHRSFKMLHAIQLMYVYTKRLSDVATTP